MLLLVTQFKRESLTRLIHYKNHHTLVAVDVVGVDVGVVVVGVVVAAAAVVVMI